MHSNFTLTETDEQARIMLAMKMGIANPKPGSFRRGGSERENLRRV